MLFGRRKQNRYLGPVGATAAASVDFGQPMGVHWKVAVVEDDLPLARAVTASLRREGYRVRSARTRLEGLAMLREWSPDLVLLDLMLPDSDSSRVLGEFRSETSAGLVGMTAMSSLADVVAGLRVGADDYITKPFSHEELTARVAAVLRRRHAARAEIVEVGDLRIDVGAGSAQRGERQLGLTATELRLLLALAREPGHVLSKQGLAEILWAADAAPLANTIEVHVGRLRRKLGGPRESGIIATVRGFGYRLNFEGSHEAG